MISPSKSLGFEIIFERWYIWKLRDGDVNEQAFSQNLAIAMTWPDNFGKVTLSEHQATAL